MAEEECVQDVVGGLEEAEKDMENYEETFDSVDDASFSLELKASGQPGGFHTTNDPRDRFQRATVTERRGAVDIRCKSIVIIHGSFSPDSNELATLLVYDVSFNATKRFRRVASAKVSFDFASSEPNSPGPEVYAVAPSGRWSLLETTQQEHVESSTDMNLTAGFSSLSVGGAQKWTRGVYRTSKDSTIINGDTICDSYGKETGAEFVLLENASSRPKSGVPSFFRLAFLLKRKTEDEFQCTVNISVEADWKTRMGSFFACKDRDDPIYFNPELAPMVKLRGAADKFDEDDLGSTKLEDIFDATFHTTFENPIKKQA